MLVAADSASSSSSGRAVASLDPSVDLSAALPAAGWWSCSVRSGTWRDEEGQQGAHVEQRADEAQAHSSKRQRAPAVLHAIIAGLGRQSAGAVGLEGWRGKQRVGGRWEEIRGEEDGSGQA